ncbi:ABC transporter ATP-binding protein [Parafrankia sp. EUN1f]|uniref:ABC transporter ATP-binding protein n=1 Tax=Parafrankia sp. EUN1f TaxID=102897 RepID=UPI0001C46803|nr:sn-glycerol-3-phosphate ABC transporter ATP-binding protein UgpC [Parafrankia sp. EUN1f]EFC81000.1 ABC transporter related protein [Parafrankia sp. EUN1f]
MAAVEFISVARHYPGSDRPAVDALDLQVADGEFLVLVGPSGCGKSTTLRMVAGLEPVDSGQILIGGKDATNLAPKDRDIAMVFQNYALYPHMSVADNMAFSLKISGVPKGERHRRIHEAARLLDLEPYLERKPKALSGGQRQRVAMGRAVVREPQVFLMDEPLSNLDAKLRVSTRTQIASLRRRLGVTTIYVTHDQVEAMTMGDRVAVFAGGRLCQVGSPQELYEKPANVFVAGFIGSPAMNLIPAPLHQGNAQIGEALIPLPRASVQAALEAGSTSVTVGFRPETVKIAGDGEGFSATVDLVEILGSDAYLYATMILPESDRSSGTLQDTAVIARISPRNAPRKTEKIRLRVNAEEIHAFSRETGQRLPT